MATPHDRFIAPARAHPQLWRLLVGLAVIAASVLAGTVVVVLSAWMMLGRGQSFTGWIETVFTPDSAIGTLIMLYCFLGFFVGPMLAARWLHRRAPHTLFGPAARTLRDFAAAFVTVGILMAASLAIWSAGYDAVPNLEPSRWLTLLPFVILALVIQTGAEELVFRGYLQQQLAARFRPVWVHVALPSVLFGLVHFDPSLPGAATATVIGAATLFGLIAADLTRATGSIGAAWGFHMANNLFALSFVATDGSITGLALYRTPYTLEAPTGLDLLIFIDLAYVAIAWWLVRRVVLR